MSMAVMDSYTETNQNQTAIRKRILIPFILSIAVITCSIIIGAYTLKYLQESFSVEEAKNKSSNTFYQLVNDAIQQQDSLIYLIKNNQSIIQAWLEKDRQKLLNQSQHIYQYLRAEHNITHFYFHDHDLTNYLRVHNPSRYGDEIKRYTAIKSKQDKISFSGLEFGLLGQFVLRSVHPWIVNGEIIGYIELGREIERLIDNLAEIQEYDIALVIDDKFLQESDQIDDYLMNNILTDRIKLEESLIIYDTSNRESKFFNQLKIGDTHNQTHATTFKESGHNYLATSIPITNAKNEHAGHLLINKDITKLKKIEEYLTLVFASIVLITVILVLIFYVYYSKRLGSYLNGLYNKLQKEILERKKTEHELEEYSHQLEQTVEKRTRELTEANNKLTKDIELIEAAESALTESEKKYRTLFEKTPDAILIIDQNTFVDCNDATVNMLRYKSKTQLLMTHPSELSPPTQPDGRESWEKAEEMMAIALKNGSHRFEWDHKRADGEIFPVEVLLTSIPVGDRNILYTVWRDITDRKRAEEKVKHHAYFDSLTDLPNRYLFRDRLQQAIIQSERYNNSGAVLFLDLDQFKNINDSLGHTIGDSLLIEISNRLKSCLREGDTAARLGGDEFVVLLPNLSSHDVSVSTHAEKVAEKIKDAICKPIQVEQYELDITTSIGISIFSGKNESVEDILRHADTAMYRAKKDGRNSIRFFLPSMQAEVIKRLNLEKDLRQAFDKRQLHLCYQPQYNKNTNVIGVEALLRWHHPDRGAISPLDFIPIAEEIGLIIPISEWAINQSMSEILSIIRNKQLASPMRLSVNLSPYHFKQSNFIESINSLINKNNFPTDLLTVEITENVVIDNINEAIEKFTELKKLDIKISLDDFGTGYSSLGYLKQLPVDELKIDRSFVKDIETDKNDAILVETIISLAKHMRLHIVAEGVETKEQMDFLTQKGCPAFQGFYLSQPLTIDDLRDYLIASPQANEIRLV